jgi:hypothetical protein
MTIVLATRKATMAKVNKLYTRGLSEGGSVHLAQQVVNCFTKIFLLTCRNLKTTIGGQKILAP